MRLTCLSHFYNEELLIGDWIKYHSRFFDYGLLVDHNSTDRSREMAESVLPDGWQIINTSLPDFDAVLVDREMEEYEKQTSGWKMILNTTEYLFCPDLKERLEDLEKTNPDVVALGSRPVSLVDKEQLPIETPIWKNRTHGFINYCEGNPHLRHWRWIHKADHGHYTPGRHDTHLTKAVDIDFLHLHLLYSPWPECKQRKLQIQDRIPLSDKRKGFGVQHIINEAQLDEVRNRHLEISKDLLTVPEYKACYDELIKEFT